MLWKGGWSDLGPGNLVPQLHFPHGWVLVITVPHVCMEAGIAFPGQMLRWSRLIGLAIKGANLCIIRSWCCRGAARSFAARYEPSPAEEFLSHIRILSFPKPLTALLVFVRSPLFSPLSWRFTFLTRNNTRSFTRRHVAQSSGDHADDMDVRLHRCDYPRRRVALSRGSGQEAGSSSG